MMRRTLVNAIEQYLERLCVKEALRPKYEYMQIHSLLKDSSLLHKVYRDEIMQTEELMREEQLADAAAADIENIKQQLRNNLLNAESILKHVEHSNGNCSKVFLEIRSGAGGTEASFFTMEMFNFYQLLAEQVSSEYSVEESIENEAGGLVTGTMSIGGFNMDRYFDLEAGVHRVQRVPKTERGGRMHTSTCAVSILPLPDVDSVELDEKQLTFQFMRSSGRGGQRRDKVETAVLVKHVPTGMTAFCEKTRFQEQNRKYAIQILNAKLQQQLTDSIESSKASTRSKHFGRMERNEKIRTYNFETDRVIDHRCKESIVGVANYLSAGSQYFNLHEKVKDFMEEQKREELVWRLIKDLDDNDQVRSG